MRLLFFVILFLTTSANAQTAEDSLRVRQKVDTLLQITNSSYAFRFMIDEMIDVELQQFAGTEMEENLTEDFSRLRAEAVTDLEMTILPEYAAVYMRLLTEAEIEELIAFHRTELGQTMREKQPLLTQELSQVWGPWAQNLHKEIRRTIEKNRD